MVAKSTNGSSSTKDTKAPKDARSPDLLSPEILGQIQWICQVYGQAMRPPVPGTVARGELRDLTKDGPYWTGKDVSGAFVTAIPVQVKVDDALRARGKQRFEIYCAACHDKGGDGKGILFERGKVPTPSFHDDRLRQELFLRDDVRDHAAHQVRAAAGTRRGNQLDRTRRVGLREARGRCTEQARGCEQPQPDSGT